MVLEYHWGPRLVALIPCAIKRQFQWGFIISTMQMKGITKSLQTIEATKVHFSSETEVHWAQNHISATRWRFSIKNEPVWLL